MTRLTEAEGTLVGNFVGVTVGALFVIGSTEIALVGHFSGRCSVTVI